jgi:hypothetical protein
MGGLPWDLAGFGDWTSGRYGLSKSRVFADSLTEKTKATMVKLGAKLTKPSKSAAPVQKPAFR